MIAKTGLPIVSRELVNAITDVHKTCDVAFLRKAGTFLSRQPELARVCEHFAATGHPELAYGIATGLYLLEQQADSDHLRSLVEDPTP